MTREELINKMVNDVMEDFNFHIVYKVMNATNWEWAQEGGNTKIPSLYQIMKCASDLLTRVAAKYGEGNSCISTGGFEASLRDGVLKLRFILEENEAFDTDYTKDDWTPLGECNIRIE